MAAISDFFDGMHGVVFPFGGTTAPAGFLMCDGAAYSRTTYASLFAVIGTAFGIGDGSTTFNVPELRGEFIRGLDNGRGVDVGRVGGSAQADTLQNATGSLNSRSLDSAPTGIIDSGSGVFFVSHGAGAVGGRAALGATSALDATSFDLSRAVRTSSETRSRNIAMNHIIKT